MNLSDAFSSKKFVKPTVQRIEHSVAKKIEHSDNAAIEGARRLAESITPAGFILRAVGLFPLDVIPISPPAMKAIKLVNDLKDLHKEDFAALQQCRSQAHNDTVVIRKIEKSVIRDSLPKLLKQAAAALNSPMGQLIDKLFGMYVYLSDLTAGLDEIIMYACGGAGGVKDDRKRLPESVSNFFHLLSKIGNVH